jgi:radical SAM protein with 4Fe4S-binding SPASM domain
VNFKHIYIEISNVCNLQCSFCPEVERRDQKLTAADFLSIVRKVKHNTEAIYLHLMGEPLGHPEFPDIIAICSSENIPVKITTNGLLLSASRKAALLNPIVKQINFSLHSFTDNFPNKSPADYLLKLTRFTQQAHEESPHLYINFRLWDHDAQQVGLKSNIELRNELEKIFQIEIDPLMPDIRRRKNLRIQGRQYIHFDSRFEWPSLSAPKYSDQGRCYGLSNHIGIHADGTVVPCCLDKEAILNLGNIFETELEEILASPRATKIREGFANGRLTEELCQKCQFVTRFKKTKSAPKTRQTEL